MGLAHRGMVVAGFVLLSDFSFSGHFTLLSSAGQFAPYPSSLHILGHLSTC